MIVMPAIDLREGACVQLVGGDYAREVVRVSDPCAVAQRWLAAGFTRLHVVDLDAALGRGTNAVAVRRLVTDTNAEIQVGGGVRDRAGVDSALALGAARVVVGTRALEDLEWISTAAAQRPGKIVVAVDVRAGAPAVHGWTRNASCSLDGALDALRDLPLAALLVTSVEVEGRMCGPDLPLVDRVLARASVPVIASGGIATTTDLQELDARGVRAAVVGMALYTGALDPFRTAEEFAA
jgi:phosphoribosylformimino-5-aminoimidazole carboxamide ribotide isomerase